MNKRSPIQLGESITVIVIIIVLLVIGIVFWKNMYVSDIEESGRMADDLSVIEIAKIVAEMPELRCYSMEGVAEVNCFDLYKIRAFKNITESKETKDYAMMYYYSYFRNSKITFQKLYPEPEENITIYDNNITISKSLKITIPVVLKEPTSMAGTKYFGLIVVEGYYR